MKTKNILLVLLVLLAVNFVSADCIDNDNDSYGVDCVLGEDCDDNNPELFKWMNFYLDEDHDGFGTGEVIRTVCWGIGGYYIYPIDEKSFNNRDCNDLNRDINPNVLEIPGNRIDENCDGCYGNIKTHRLSIFSIIS